MIKKAMCDVVMVDRKASFDKSFTQTFRGTEKARKLAEAMGNVQFFRMNTVSYDLCKKWYAKRNDFATSAGMKDIQDIYKAMADNADSILMEFVTQNVYDAYAVGRDNNSKKTSRYDVFATAVIDWFHDFGFSVDKKTVDYIAMSIGMDINKGRNLLITGTMLKPSGAKTFCRKYVYAVCDVFGTSVKKYDSEFILKTAKLAKNDKGKWVTVKTDNNDKLKEDYILSRTKDHDKK